MSGPGLELRSVPGPITYNLLDAGKITRAIEGPGMLRMQPFRLVRNRAMREFGGPWYGRGSEAKLDDGEKRPVNLLYQFVRTYLPNLVGPRVSAKVSARTIGLQPQARIRELMLNHVLEEMNLARTWRLVVQDALLGGLGICRMGLRAGEDMIDVGGELFDPGQPYVVRVDLDDFVRDPQSRDQMEDTWRAFRYRVNKQDLLDLGIYDPEVLKTIPLLGEDHVLGDAEESDEVMGDRDDQDPVTEQVELWDCLYYQGDKVLEGTLAGLTGKWLMPPREYNGREGAPLELLSLVDMPNNAMPVSPAAVCLDLHLAMAAASTKMTRQLLKTKMNYIVSKTGEDTGMELADSEDQEIFIGDGTAVTAVKSGGLLPEMVPAFAWLEAQANNQASLALLSGADDPSKSATVGNYLQSNASVLLNDWRGTVQASLRKVVRTVGWYMDTDPRLQRTFSYKIAGGVEIDVEYDAQAKEGDFSDFMWDVQPFADTAIDPSLKMRRLSELMVSLPPFLQTVQMMGGNLEAAVEVIASEFQVPQLEEVFPTQGGQMQAAMVQQMAMKAAGSAGPRQRPGQPTAKPAAGNRPIDQVRSDVAPTVPV